MNETPTVLEVVKLMEALAPKELAMEGDKIGLQVGSLNKPIKRVMVTLDLLENVVDEAIEKGVDLIISHHAFIYRPLKTVNTNQEKGRILEKLLKNDISVFVAHTNLDIALGGVNDMLFDVLGLQDRKVLVELGKEKLYKLVVFVPENHQEDIREAVASNGAGHIGNYSHCTFQTSGLGTFKPLEGTNPFIGSQGELEKVAEVRLETIVPESSLNSVVQAIIQAHPYEEVAYDVYPLKIQGNPYGLGRMGELDKPYTLKEFVEHVKELLEVPMVRVVGDLNKKIQTVGVIGGDGNNYIYDAKRRGCDVLITGDVYYHTAHDALGIGLNLIDPGHNVEKVVIKGLQTYLIKGCQEKNLQIDIIGSDSKTEPFQFI
jgi:dinuclear metal center YbgI/SA1388 family protein